MLTALQVHQGYFDILFPTNFAVIEMMYRAMTNNWTRVYSHADFMSGTASVEKTQTRNGDSPLLNWYKNASVMITV